MRLIDADALECDTEWSEYADDYTSYSKFEIDTAPTIDPVPRWISCEERLPEPNLAVLGYAPKFDNIFAVYYDSVCGWITWNPVHDEPFPSFQGKIVAWMPMPAPYEGERKDDDED